MGSFHSLAGTNRWVRLPPEEFLKENTTRLKTQTSMDFPVRDANLIFNYLLFSLSLRGVPSLHVTPASPTSSRFLRESLTRQSHVCFPRDVLHNPETWRRGRQCKRGSFGIRFTYRGSPGERMTMDMTRELCAWPWIRHTGASFFQGLETKKRFLGTPESLVCKDHYLLLDFFYRIFTRSVEWIVHRMHLINIH